MVVYITGIILSWSGFLIGLIRWSLKRNLASFEDKLTDTAAIAAKATLDLGTHKEDIQKEITNITAKLNNMPAGCGGHQMTEQRLNGHSDRLGQHKELIVKIEGEFKSMPKKHDLDAVYDRVNKVSEQMSDLRSEISKIAGTMPGLTHITEMMNDFLLRQGGKN
jgi:chromosome segregation ATPase